VAAGGTIRRVEPVLVTERLVLRRVTAADVDNLLALDGDPEVMRYLEPRTRSRAEIEAEVLPLFLGLYARYRDFGRWAADTRAGGEFIGWFGLRPVRPSADAIVHWPDAPPDSGVAEVGYRLRRSAWGHGYATEGARALIRRAFTELGVQEVVATTMAVNTRSRAVMARAGLRYARTVHLTWDDPLDGNEHGDVEYRLRREEWARQPVTGAG
jgi:RimJ/RimL family protein N-acetyltransferase